MDPIKPERLISDQDLLVQYRAVTERNLGRAALIQKIQKDWREQRDEKTPDKA